MKSGDKIDKLFLGDVPWVIDLKSGIRAIDGRINKLEVNAGRDDVRINVLEKIAQAKMRPGKLKVHWLEIVEFVVEAPVAVRVLFSVIMTLCAAASILWKLHR